MLCKDGYEHELAKLTAERTDKPVSGPEATNPGLPHWLQRSSDQNQVRVFAMLNLGKANSCFIEILIDIILRVLYSPRHKS
jgi:hypothetical protein